MDADKAVKTVMAAVVLVAAVVIAFTITPGTNTISDEPSGLMTGGDERIHPCGLESGMAYEIPWDEVIYVPTSPKEKCPPGERVSVDWPIRIEEPDGTVHWHQMYENRSMARNRTTLR